MIDYVNSLFGSDNYLKMMILLINSLLEFDKVKDTIVKNFNFLSKFFKDNKLMGG